MNLTAVPLSAVSRPQFDLARHRVPRRPQPVSPTFEQEALSAAIHVAAHHRRREHRLGASAIKAILSAKLAPVLDDRLHADRPHGGQMTDEPDRHRAGNLIETAPGHGARERVGRRASGFAPAMWLGEHRGVVASLGLPAVAGVAAALVAPSRSGLRRP